jgi:hypothetical protein
MELALVKQIDGTLKVAYDSDIEKLKNLKVGEVYLFNTNLEREPLLLRKFFALIRMVYDNQECYKSIDVLREDLLILSGHYDRIITDKGTIVKAKSISFDKIEEDEFRQVFSNVIDTIITEFNFSKREIKENIKNYF